ncbi:MAG: RHS repeat-associated core domain-containing protein [Planctomycetota bacterium]
MKPFTHPTSWLRLLRSLVALLLLAVTVQSQEPDNTDPEKFTFTELSRSLSAVSGEMDKANSVKQRHVPVTSSGEFTHEIALHLPPGRLAMTPSLALSYSSGRFRSDSAVGAGWSLDVGRISRSTLRGYPPLVMSSGHLVYDDAASEFESPQGRLTPVALGPAGATGSLYAPLREQQAFRYEFLPEGTQAPAYLTGRLQNSPKGGMWIEHDPSGVRRYYGAEPLLSSAEPRRAQVLNELGAFEWLLVLEEDPHGNSISYEYHHIDEQDRADLEKPQREPVLARVSWGGNVAQNQSHVFVAETTIGAQAQGPLNLMAGGTYLDSRIDKISIGSLLPGAPTLTPVPPRRPPGRLPLPQPDAEPKAFWVYELKYRASNDTGRFLLASVTRRAPGEFAEITSFEYTQNSSFTWGAAQELPAHLARVYTQKSTVQGFDFDRATVAGVLSPADLRSASHFLDFDGDGDSDIIYHPAGLGATAAWILEPSSFLQQSPASWQQVESTLTEFGIPSQTFISVLADVDGDLDTDGLTFYSEAAFTPSRGRPPTFVASEDLCSNDDFWNRCGDIDPLPPDFDGPLEKAGFTPVDPSHPEGPIVIAGLLPQSTRERPLLLLVHPPKELRGQAEKLPPLFGERSARREPPTPGSRIGVEDPKLGRRDDRPKPDAGQRDLEADLEDPRKEEAPLFDVRAGSVRWETEPGGRGPRPGGLDPVMPGCLEQVEACIEIQSGFGGDVIPGRDPSRPPDLVLGPIEGFRTYTTDLSHDCRGVTVADMPLSVFNNQSVPALQGVAPSQILPDWPRSAIQRLMLDVERTPGRGARGRQYTTNVLSDVLVPVTDVNGDGRADIVLLKWMNRILGAPPAFRFVPRVYLGAGDHFELDLHPRAHLSQFTSSLVEILNDGHFEECLTPEDDRRLYPKIVNYNAMLVELNGDGLPDLVVARPPSRPRRGVSQRLQPIGHRVLLNRGFRWDPVDLPGSTFESFPPGGSGSAPPHPFTLLRNRELSILPAELLDSVLERGATVPASAMALTDINADGRVDCVFVIASAIGPRRTHVFLNNGRGFVETKRYQFPQSFALVVEPQEGFDNPRARILSDMGRFVDIDGDALMDLITPGLLQPGPRPVSLPPRWHRNLGVVPDLLAKVSSSTGSRTQVDYVAATSAEGHNLVTSELRPPAQMVVKRVRTAAGPPPSAVAPGAHTFAEPTITLRYRDFVRDMATSETIGFEEITSTFENALPSGVSWEGEGPPINSVVMKRTYDVTPVQEGIATRHPLRGLLREMMVESGQDRTIERIDYAVIAQGEGARIRTRNTRTSTCVLGAGEAESCRDTQTQVLQFDDLGNAAVSVSGFSDGEQVLEDRYRVRLERKYENRSAPFWIVGLKREERLVGYREDMNGESESAALLSHHRWFYDEKGLVTEQHRPGLTQPSEVARLQVPEDEVLTYGYNALGLPTSMTNNALRPGRLQMRLEYEHPFLHASSREVKVTQFRNGKPRTATPLTEQYRTDLRTGRVVALKDFQGKLWRSVWDSRGRLLKRVAPDGTPLEAHGYRDHYPVKVTSAIRTSSDASFTKVQYLDGQGNLLALLEGSESGAKIRREWRVLDAFGRAVVQYRPAFVADLEDRTPGASEPHLFTTFDGIDRTIAMRYPDGRITRRSYEPFVETEIDAEGNRARRELDWRNRIAAVTRQDPAGQEVARYEYVRDGAGRIVRVVDPDGNEQRLGRDLGGRIAKAELPHAPGAGAAVFEMSYDLNDELLEMHTPLGRLVTITRDEIGRAVQYVASGPDGPAVHSLEYDVPSLLAMGRLAATRDESGEHRYAYDELGHRRSITYLPAPELRAAAGALAPRYVLELEHGPADHLLRSTLKAIATDGAETILGSYQHARDALGRLTGISSTDGANTSALAAGVILDAHNRLTQMTLASGLICSWNYDPASERLDRISCRAGSTDLISLEHEYDDNGNPLREVFALIGQASREKSYSYDSLDRLTSASVRIGNTTQSATYEYTPGGNLVVAAGESYAYEDPHLAQAVTHFLTGDDQTRTLAYNADGRLTSDQYTPVGANIQLDREIRYDGMGLVREVRARRLEAGAVAADISSTILTDHKGERVARRTLDAIAGTTAHVIELGDFVEILPEQGLARIQVRAENVLILEDARSLATGARVPPSAGFVHTDLRGSVVAQSSFAAPAQLSRATDYDAWGQAVPLGGLPMPDHAFLATDLDPVSGHHQLGPRLYDPSLRRFLAPDPFLWSRPELEVLEGGQLNLYSYAANNPVRRTDANGLQAADEPGSEPQDKPGWFAQQQQAFEKSWDSKMQALKDKKDEIVGDLRGMAEEKVGGWANRTAGREAMREQWKDSGTGTSYEHAIKDDRETAKRLERSLEEAAKAAKKPVDVVKGPQKPIWTAFKEGAKLLLEKLAKDKEEEKKP